MAMLFRYHRKDAEDAATEVTVEADEAKEVKAESDEKKEVEEAKEEEVHEEKFTKRSPSSSRRRVWEHRQ